MYIFFYFNAPLSPTHRLTPFEQRQSFCRLAFVIQIILESTSFTFLYDWNIRLHYYMYCIFCLLYENEILRSGKLCLPIINQTNQ